NPQGPSDSGIRTTFGHQGQYLALAWSQRVERLWLCATHQQVNDELGVKDHLSFVDPLERVKQLVDVCNGILQEVADAAGRGRIEEADCLLRLDIAREKQYRHPGESAANFDRGTNAFLRLCRRHVDVDDRDVRGVSFHLLKQRRRIADLS